MRYEGKLTNKDGEFIASGPCEVNFESGEITMWPSWELHMLERQRGPLTLELEDGRTLDISDRHLTFKLSGPSPQRISVYRLRLRERVPEHLAAGFDGSLEEEEDVQEQIVIRDRPALRVVSTTAETDE